MRSIAGRFVLALLVVLAAKTAAQQPLEVYFLNVDQGDATLVVSPSGKSLLIDGGVAGKGTGVVVPLLKGLQLTHLTYMVATHYHSDHIGGLGEVVAAGYKPLVAYDRGTYGGVPSNSTYRRYESAVASVRRILTPGTVIDLGSGVIAECMVVNGQVKGGPNVNILGASQFENAASAGFKIRFGSFHLWVGGDVPGGGMGTVDVESHVALRTGDLDVVQINHHGSNDATNWAFVYGLSPEVTVISCGNNNPYGFPHTEVLQRLGAFPTVQVVYQTTRGTGKPGGVWVNGTLRLRTGGLTSYTVDGGVISPRTFPVDEALPPPPHPRVPGELVVSEFLANPARVDDSVGEYVEVRNTTNRTLDLIGLTLRDEGIDSIHIEKSIPVEPGGAVLVGRNAAPLVNGGFVPDLVVDPFYLSNSGDEIRLDDPWGTVLDAVRYTSSTYPVSSGVAAERKSLAGPGTASNFTAAVTPFGLGDLGTPGNPNAADPNFRAHVALSAGMPLTGRTLTLRLAGPAWKIHFLVLSALRIPTPLPGSITLGVGLDLLPLSFNHPGWIGTLGAGVTTASLPIPDESALKGLTFYLQMVILGTGGLPETVSDVVRLKIG